MNRIARLGLCVTFVLGIQLVAKAAIETEVVVSGFSSPVFVTAPQGDNRLFVVEKGGLIRIVQGGSVLPTPFLDISTTVLSSGSEQGLLGLAFHPNYDSNGRFYVHYSSMPSGDTALAEYVVSGNPDVANSGSATILLTAAQFADNHNGGMIAFKPGEAGNFLYLALGDGGGGGDPNQNGQDINTVLGSIVRLDVDNAGQAVSTNPFVGQAGDDRIWVYGLRNPWRFSFDRQSGDMYIGDVGQVEREEVDFLAAASTGGENFGWDLLEGSADFECTDCDGARMTTELPIHEYVRTDGISIIGGYVYRGGAIPSLQGAYFFADLLGRFWSFRYDSATLTDFQEHIAGFPGGQTIVSFGEDGSGELYIVSFGGTIYRVIDTTQIAFGDIAGAGFHEAGDSVTLAIDVSGTTGAVTYEWFKAGVGPALSDGGHVSGATTPSLNFAPAELADSGTYTLRVTDQSKGILSAPSITITVVAPGSLPLSGLPVLLAMMASIAVAGMVYNRRKIKIANRP